MSDRPAPKPVRVLFVAANPGSTARLRVAAELRTIRDRLRGAKLAASIDLVTTEAARPNDLRRALLEIEPHILHFSGHGTSHEELLFEDDDGGVRPVSKEALVSLLGALQDSLRVVVLNACHSRPQAEAITQHVDCAVGMSRAVSDKAAIQFAVAFYEALAFGKSVQLAFTLGANAPLLNGVPEDQTPRLLVRPGIDPAGVTLVQPAPPAPAVRRFVAPALIVTALAAIALSLALPSWPTPDAATGPPATTTSPPQPPAPAPPAPTSADPPSQSAIPSASGVPTARPVVTPAPARDAAALAAVHTVPADEPTQQPGHDTSGSATCVAHQCTLALTSRGLDPKAVRVCLRAQAPPEIAGAPLTCVLVAPGSPSCTRSDKYATTPLVPPITWSTCP